MHRLINLSLAALLLSGCPVDPPAPAPVTLEEVAVTPRWSDALGRVELVAGDANWKLTAQPEAGGVTGVQIDAGSTCTGHIWRSRVSSRPVADRSSALEGRILDRVEASGVEGVVVRDHGEVPLGELRAHMVRLDGTLDGRPWSSRVTATLVTRQSGRFYVEVAVVSGAPSFVARRNCFDAITAAVTIHAERR